MFVIYIFFVKLPKLTRDWKFSAIFLMICCCRCCCLFLLESAQLDISPQSMYGIFSLMRTQVVGNVLSKWRSVTSRHLFLHFHSPHWDLSNPTMFVFLWRKTKDPSLSQMSDSHESFTSLGGRSAVQLHVNMRSFRIITVYCICLIQMCTVLAN